MALTTSLAGFHPKLAKVKNAVELPNMAHALEAMGVARLGRFPALKYRSSSKR
jgi:hypothetical protein